MWSVGFQHAFKSLEKVEVGVTFSVSSPVSTRRRGIRSNIFSGCFSSYSLSIFSRSDRPICRRASISSEVLAGGSIGTADDVRINGIDYALSRDRIFVLHDEGTVEQLSFPVTLGLARNPVIFGKRLSEVKTRYRSF